MFSTPLTASSIGTATVRATTSALAPGYTAVTCTLGGAISGNKVIGRENKDSPPNSNSMMETTVDNTGRSINLFNINCVLTIGSKWLRFQKTIVREHLRYNDHPNHSPDLQVGRHRVSITFIYHVKSTLIKITICVPH